MDEDFQKENWIVLSQSALIELEDAKIEDALRGLKFLEREHARLDEEAHHRAIIEESLQKLRSVHQSVQRLSKRAHAD